MVDDFSNLASPQVIGRMLYLVNTERSDASLPPVAGDEALHRAAQAHSEDMARRGFLDTLTPDSTSAEGLAARAGYPGQASALVYSGPTSIAAVAAWMAGPARALLLSPHLSHLGIGLADSKWTLILGAAADGPPLAVLPAAQTSRPPAAPPAPVDLGAVDGSGDTIQMNLQAPTESINAVTTAKLAAARQAALEEPPPAPPLEGGAEPSGLAPPLELGAEAAPAPAAPAFSLERIAPTPLQGAPAAAAPAPAVAPAPAAAPAQAAPAPAPPAPPTQVLPHLTSPAVLTSSPALVQQVLALVNRERARWHLPQLALSEPLTRAAQEHATDMSLRAYHALIGPDGDGAAARAARLGYGGRCGGVLAVGPINAESALDHWLADASSQASLLNGEYIDLGVGLQGGRWVLLLGMAAAAPAPQPEPSRTGLPFGLPNLNLGALSGALSMGRGAPGPQAPDPQLANRVMILINTERAKLALVPLSVNEALCQAAQAHSNDMAARDYFAYVGPDGQGVESRVAESRYPGRSGANLCMGQGSPEAAVKFFLQNEGNRQNLVYPDYRHLGVGAAKGRWTLVFGIPEAAAQAAGPQVLARTLELINQERARAGLPGLALSQQLTQAAQAHAEDMARRNYVGSVSPEGEDVGKRVDRAGYRWRSVTESTASDRASPEAAVEAWMRTADHRANILDKSFRHVGIGVEKGRWSLVFAHP